MEVCLSGYLSVDANVQAKYKYNAWKEISHISAQKAQGRYIEHVSGLLEKYGSKEC